MAFLAFQTEAYGSNMTADEVKPGNLLERGEQIQSSCLKTVVTFLGEYRGPTVRRPMSGISPKQESHAFITVRKSNGEIIPLFNSVGDVATERGQQIMGNHYTDFILQSVMESRAERAQVLETFGETFLYLYGERPRTQLVTGLLLNTHDFPWRTEFWLNYDTYLRGTKCVENKARVYLSWDDVMLEGYVLSAEAQEVSQEPYQVSFSMTLLVTDYLLLGSQLFATWAQAAAESQADPTTLFDFTKDLFDTSKEGSAEYLGSLQDDVKSMTTGRAVLVSQDMKEWLLDQPWEIFSQLDPCIASIIQFGTDPKGFLKEKFGSPLQAFSTIQSVTPAGLIPNEVCLAAVAAEDIMRFAQDPFGGMMGALSASTPWIESGLDQVSLLSKEAITDLLGGDGGGFTLEAV